MFTGRSEFRLTLRSDNADLRLTEKGYLIGCVSEQRYNKFRAFKEKYDAGIVYLKSIIKSAAYWKSKIPSLPMMATNPVNKSMFELLKFDNCSLETLKDLIEPEFKFLYEDENIRERVKIQSVYDEEEARQLEEIDDVRKNESISIPANFDYNQILNLSNEAKEKLFTHRPTSIGAAGRVPGLTPSSVFRLFAHFKNDQKLSIKQ